MREVSSVRFKAESTVMAASWRASRTPKLALLARAARFNVSDRQNDSGGA